MYTSAILFLSLLLTIQSSLSVLIDFTNSDSSVTQICSSHGHPDVCCIPLDINIFDGRGYGWFHTAQVSFNAIDSPDTFTAVYRSGLPLLCSGEILAQRNGDQNWHTGELRLGVGSALAMGSFTPQGMKTRWPDFIVARGVVYKFVSREGSERFQYKSEEGAIMFGRMYRNPLAHGGYGEQSGMRSVTELGNVTGSRETA